MTIDTKTSTPLRKHDHLWAWTRCSPPLLFVYTNRSTTTYSILVHVIWTGYISALELPSYHGSSPPFFRFLLSSLRTITLCISYHLNSRPDAFVTHSFRHSLFYKTMPQFGERRFSLALLCIMLHIDPPPSPPIAHYRA